MCKVCCESSNLRLDGLPQVIREALEAKGVDGMGVNVSSTVDFANSANPAANEEQAGHTRVAAQPSSGNKKPTKASGGNE